MCTFVDQSWSSIIIGFFFNRRLSRVRMPVAYGRRMNWKTKKGKADFKIRDRSADGGRNVGRTKDDQTSTTSALRILYKQNACGLHVGRPAPTKPGIPSMHVAHTR